MNFLAVLSYVCELTLRFSLMEFEGEVGKNYAGALVEHVSDERSNKF